MKEITLDSNASASQQIDYSFLLLTHIVCADRQIHSEESKYLRQLANLAGMGQQTENEMEKILAQDDHHLSVEDIACRVLTGQQNEAMQQILAIAYADGFFAPLERELVDRIARLWNYSTGEVERLIQEAQFSGKDSSQNEKQQDLSIAARLLRNEQKSPLSRAVIGIATKLAPNTVGRKVEQLEREILLSGPDYDAAIEQCAKIASEDYEYAKLALQNTLNALSDLGRNLQLAIEQINYRASGNGRASTAKEVAKQLENTKNNLTNETIQEIENVRKSLHDKQRALNHFSIAFMGKTKAGKSTLHAIITQDGWEAIGVGKQRTTRFNRVYEWKNIRIIDTPGIGAPGGRTDEEVAESVIGQSDVICYVVTNDSTQKTEFQFMKLLKEKAKPLIILFNVKHNLCDPRRLERFLKDPDKLFAMDGKDGLCGHFEKIRRDAQEHCANDNFPIIPVLLLAAQLSREPEHQEYKDKLFKASRIQDFLDLIRTSLIKHGAIRRSQTLLGSTVGDIDKPEKWIVKETDTYHKLLNTLKSKRESIRKQIQIATKDSQESLLQQIELIFQDAVNAIPTFAEEHWNSNEAALKLGWEQKLKVIKLNERLKTVYEGASQKFSNDVKEVLEEVGKELQLIAKLDDGNFSFTEQDSNDFRSLLTIGGSLLAVSATIATMFVLPFAPLIGIAAIVIGGIAGFFKSKNEKRREAVQKISSSLNQQISSYKQKTLQQIQEEFSKYCDSVATAVDTYFEELIQGLEAIASQLELARKRLDGTANYLNRAYAKRILDWSIEQYEPLSDEAINQNIAKVQRDFGRNITIYPRAEIKLKKSQDEIKQVLQEDISIQLS
ncbi:GTPase [cyanobacterium TDX16]|nr:GTPase [cyanobacterium TDX16]